MRWREISSRDVAQEGAPFSYQVVFWDFIANRSHAYELSDVGHVAEVLQWAQTQIGIDGLHPGCHPEIGARQRRGAEPAFLRLSPEYSGIHRDGGDVPSPPLVYEGPPDIGLQVLMSGIPVFVPNDFGSEAVPVGAASDEHGTYEIRIDLTTTTGPVRVATAKATPAHGITTVRHRALVKVAVKQRRSTGRDMEADLTQDVTDLERAAMKEIVVTIDDTPHVANVLDLADEWFLFAEVEELGLVVNALRSVQIASEWTKKYPREILTATTHDRR